MASRMATIGGVPLRLRRLDAPDSRIESPSPPMRAPIHTFLCLERGEAMIAVDEDRVLLHAGDCVLIPVGQPFAVLYYNNCVGYMGGFATEFMSDGQSGNLLRRSEALRGWKMVRAWFAEDDMHYVATILSACWASVVVSATKISCEHICRHFWRRSTTEQRLR